MEKILSVAKIAIVAILSILFLALFVTIAKADDNRTKSEFLKDQKRLEIFLNERLQVTKRKDIECFKILQSWYHLCFDNNSTKCEKLENQKKACL